MSKLFTLLLKDKNQLHVMQSWSQVINSAKNFNHEASEQANDADIFFAEKACLKEMSPLISIMKPSSSNVLNKPTWLYKTHIY